MYFFVSFEEVMTRSKLTHIDGFDLKLCSSRADEKHENRWNSLVCSLRACLTYVPRNSSKYLSRFSISDIFCCLTLNYVVAVISLEIFGTCTFL